MRPYGGKGRGIVAVGACYPYHNREEGNIRMIREILGLWAMRSAGLISQNAYSEAIAKLCCTYGTETVARAMVTLRIV